MVHTIRVGRRALLVEVDDAAQALSLAVWARSVPVSSDEVVPAATSVLFDGVADVASLRRQLAGWVASAPTPHGDLVEVPVRYDGADLAFVGEVWGMTQDEVVATHAGAEYVSAFCGFAPGFSYLRGLPEELAVPRLDSPRSRVPAGSVALAGTWCGVYPVTSPGGWRILGTTDAVLWDQDRASPALLPPGVRVRFVPR